MMSAFISAVFLSITLLLVATHAEAGLDEELVFYLTFDSITDQTIVDKSGNGLDAKIIENTEIVKGKYGDAIHITRAGGNCVNVSSQEKLKITGEITMMAWGYQQETWKGLKAHLIDKDCHTAGADTSYGIAIVDVGDGPEIWLILGSRQGQGQARQDIVVPTKVVDKKWHHFAASYDGETVKVYLDGEVIGEGQENFNFSGDNDADVRIGCTKDFPNSTFVNGLIDETAVWRRALSDDEIKQAMIGDFLAVSPNDKVAATWADIKRRAAAP